MAEEIKKEEIKTEAVQEETHEVKPAAPKIVGLGGYTVIDYIETAPGEPKKLVRVQLDHTETPNERKARYKRLKEEKKLRKLGYPMYETEDKGVKARRRTLKVLNVFTKLFRIVWIPLLIIGILFTIGGPAVYVINILVVALLAIATIGLILLGEGIDAFMIPEEIIGQLLVIGVGFLIAAGIFIVADIVLAIIKSVIKKKLRQIAAETQNGTAVASPEEIKPKQE